MAPVDDETLLNEVRASRPDAWERLIAAYQGRLLAFAEQRLGDRAAAEDVVQETFLGFLLALPNYRDSTPLESFLFSIAAHKLTDQLRRRGRRPWLTLAASDSGGGIDPAGPQRRASSLVRSAERKTVEERVLGDCLKQLVQSWISRGEFERLMCAELLFVRGHSNQGVAQSLSISEQAVANHKSFVVQKLKAAAAAARLRDVDWQQLNAE
jgi:RNA polymerase sigma-70 factor, ECF subfamily